MASALQIAQLALSYFADKARITSIDPSDGSFQADKCEQFYPIARQTILEEHPWSFAVYREAGALSGTAAPSSWTYRYVWPSNCLRLLAVLSEDSADGDDSQPYDIEIIDDGTRTILTDTENADLRWIRDITDTTKYSPSFVVALSYLLSSMMCGPITKNDKKADALLLKYNDVFLPKAKGLDANGVNNYDKQVQNARPARKSMAPWVRAR
jgi:hypothetical protein